MHVSGKRPTHDPVAVARLRGRPSRCWGPVRAGCRLGACQRAAEIPGLPVVMVQHAWVQVRPRRDMTTQRVQTCLRLRETPAAGGVKFPKPWGASRKFPVGRRCHLAAGNSHTGAPPAVWPGCALWNVLTKRHVSPPGRASRMCGASQGTPIPAPSAAHPHNNWTPSPGQTRPIPGTNRAHPQY